jgi:hypothetical protein
MNSGQAGTETTDRQNEESGGIHGGRNGALNAAARVTISYTSSR